MKQCIIQQTAHTVQWLYPWGLAITTLCNSHQIAQPHALFQHGGSQNETSTRESTREKTGLYFTRANIVMSVSFFTGHERYFMLLFLTL